MTSPNWTGTTFNFPTREELLRGTAGQRSCLRASERWQYSNLGMALLGEVVAAASGQPYEQFVQQRILQPLQMADTRSTLPQALAGSRLAQGFGALKRDGSRDPLPSYDARGLVAAAGFSSTVDDLARFAAWQFRLRKKGGQELLKVATLREMQRVHWLDPNGNNTWGLGFAVDRDGSTTIASHTGVCPGQLSSLALALGEEVALVAMTNANDNRTLSRLTGPMRRLMLKGLKLPVAPASGPALESYAGAYQVQPWSSEMVVLPWGAGLAVMFLPSNDPAGGLTVLKHVQGDNFRMQRDDGIEGMEYQFVRSASGQVSELRMWSQRYPKLAR